ncbi:MAG: hypothetical protein ACI9TV_000066 [Sulfurimonas sp.]|jgi:hypothetical protein|uniref:hypothetical protein n=1 Tax=Sulfurimonas sp. TaxID=2022749 RepID=UPI0039E52442
MKLFFLFLVLNISLFGSASVEVGKMFENSQKCKACHLHIVNQWKESWHAKSHYANDEYFAKTIDYVKRKTRKSLNGVKVQCATCHNPRISVTSTGIDYEIDAVMGLDKDSDVNKALSSENISEGINCVVCHNIDKIHTSADESIRGINRVEWTKSGVMSGPYEDSASPYHKVEHREFMDNKPDQLCFVCHANDRSVSGLVFTDMKSEYKKNKKSCVDCHMGKRENGLAATIRDTNGQRKQRKVRTHRFEGAHTPYMWKDALELTLTQKKNDLLIEIKNPQPHNIPSGFGSRELVVEVIFHSKAKDVKTKIFSLTKHYTSKRNKPTIPHLAVKQSKDMSIQADEKKILKVNIESNSDRVDVNLYYVLVNDEVRTLLKLEEKIWSKRNFIAQDTLKLQ